MAFDPTRRHYGHCIALSVLTLAAARAPAQAPPATAPTTSQATTGPALMGPPAPEPKKIPLSFKNAPIDQIATFLSEHMGKPVISKGLEQIKLTVVNPKPLPLSEALEILRTALNEYGVAIEERERTIHLIPIDQVSKAQLRTIPAAIDVSTLDPGLGFVRKIFKLDYYDPAKLIDVLKPLMRTGAHLTAEPSTGKLIVVDTVEHLVMISRIIDDLDQPDVRGGQIKVFEIKHVDVAEIIPILRQLIGGYLGVQIKSVTTSAGPSGGMPSGPRRPGQPGPGGPSRNGATPAAGVASVTVKPDSTPVLIIPDPRRSSMIVLAPSNVVAQIETWLEHLDQPQPRTTDTEIVEVKYGDPEEVAKQLNTMLASYPDQGLRNALQIIPFGTSQRLMIVGSDANRKMVTDWLEQIDEAGQPLEMRTFELENADAQEVADMITELFEENTGRSGRYYPVFIYGGSRGGGAKTDRSKVTVSADTRRNSITVVASPEKMAGIIEQVAKWDSPLAGDLTKPRVFDLKYIDPEETKTLLENLFSKKEDDGFSNWWFGQDTESSVSPVGRLHGQFMFEAYPDTGRLIVVSKTEDNFPYIEELIAELDRPQTIGLPRVIQLKFADAETLAEQLNALLNAPGTPASILRQGRRGEFSRRSDDTSPFSTDGGRQQGQPGPQGPNQQGQQNARTMPFWWANLREDTRTKQPSTLVGKVRIVPHVEQNLLLVAASEEDGEAIEELVAKLDRPVLQVLVKAVIAEITHDDSMSLGYRFSTDPSAFITGDPLLTENALRGLINYSFEDAFGQQHLFNLNLDVNNLLSALGKVTKLRIKSEPKILTADNVEAEFFDGQDIPFISNVQLTDVGTRNDSFEYREVGLTLRVRPHITQEKRIDLLVNLEISNIIPGRTLFGGAIVDRREMTTRVVLEHGGTFLLSGILREEEREIVRRIPGLGDIPLIGELFKHRETAIVNTELLIFITPYVIGPDSPSDEIEKLPQERLQQQFGEDAISMDTDPPSPGAPVDAEERGVHLSEE